MFGQLIENIRLEALKPGKLDKYSRQQRQLSPGARKHWRAVKDAEHRTRRRAERKGEREAMTTGETPSIPVRATKGYAD